MAGFRHRPLWLLAAIAVVALAATALSAFAFPAAASLAVAVLGAVVILGCALDISTGQHQEAVIRSRTLREATGAGRHLGSVGGDSQSLLEAALALLARLEASELRREQLASALRNLDYGVLLVDRERRIEFLNRRAARELGIEQERAEGQRLWELARLPELDEILTEAFDEGAVVRREVVERSLGRRDRHLDIRATPAVGSAGTTASVVIAIADLSDLRRLETVRRDFVANVSHELKTPLTAIRGMMETIADDPDMPPATRATFIGRVLTQCGRLSELVGDLLILSRVESMEDAERSPVDLVALARSAAEHLRPAAEAKRIRLDTGLPSERLQVSGDHEALRQVFDNLVDNAVKYTPEDGRVAIQVLREDDQVLVRVSDTGIGIAAGDVERIFERFFRVDKARSRELGSTGLGLSIVKHVVAAHDGRIDVHSRPGDGSTFEVRLPLMGESG